MKCTFNEVEGKKYRSIQASRIDTKGKILDFQDSVNYDRIFAGEGGDKCLLIGLEYDGVTHKAKNIFKHYMDQDDFMLLAFDISVGRKDVEYTEYKGNPDPKYPKGYEARELKVVYDAEAKIGPCYKIDFRKGPGKPSESGAVSMDRGADPTLIQSLSFYIKVGEARRAFMAARDYYSAKMAAALSNNWDLLYNRKD